MLTAVDSRTSMVGVGGAMDFRVLGPVEVWVGGDRVDAGPPQQRGVLAALLVDAGRAVPLQTLIDRVWGQTPPHQAREGLYAHIARIRRMLSTDGHPSCALVRRSGGYALDVDPLR